MKTEFPVLNVFECSLCQGPVDRHEHCFQCRECKALGDLITGIMSPTYEQCQRMFNERSR